MNNTLKKLLLAIPPVRIRFDELQEARRAVLASEEKITKLKTIIAASRSPGLTSSTEDMLTERLLAHPVRSPRPLVQLTSVPPIDIPNRVEIAERLLSAYHSALANEELSPLQRVGEDLWTGLLRNELPELMRSIDRRDPVALAEFLKHFGNSYVWFGGITTCIDGYNRNLDTRHVALTYLDKLVCLAESIGVLRFENPEDGPWGENLFTDPSLIVEHIERDLGTQVSPPLGIIHTDGIATRQGVFHYRHINSLYSAIRAVQVAEENGSVCEIGGGIGLTAMYASRLGIADYTILDLPITCLLAGHYLLHAINQHDVALYGEPHLDEAPIKILPYWECLNLPSKKFDLILNQDSLPEISDNLIMEFLDQSKRIGRGLFLSINHESFHPRTVRNFAISSGGFRNIYRSKCWVREGYVEELYKFRPS